MVNDRADSFEGEREARLALASRELAMNNRVAGFGLLSSGNHLRLCLMVCSVAGLVGACVFISAWLALVLGAGVMAFAVSLARPLSLGYVMIAVIALLSGTERGRMLPLLQPNEVFLLLSVYMVLLLTLGKMHRPFRAWGYLCRAYVILVIGAVLIPIVVYLLRGTPLTIYNGLKILAPLQYFFLFWLFATLADGEQARRGLINWMLACGSIVAGIGILQALGVGFVVRLLANWYKSSHLAMASSAGRVTSLLGAWNSLGVFLMVNLLVAWSILPGRTGRSRTLLVISMALCAVCLVASGSYAGILGLVLGIVLIESLSERRNRAASMLVLFLLAIVFVVFLSRPILDPLVSKRLAYQYQDSGIVPHTLLYRITVWREIFIPAILQHFPWPVYPTVPESYDWGFEESQYISLLFRTGLTGLIGHLAWVGVTVYWLNRKRRLDTGFTSMISIAAMTIVIVLSILSFTNEVFSFSGSIDYLWIMLALIASSTDGVQCRYEAG